MIICTVATKSHLGYARVLATSLRAFNPTAQLVLLLADRVDGMFDPATEPFKIIFLEDLGYPELLSRMAMYYTAFEFSNALKPFLHEYLWKNTSAEWWVYLDSDIYVKGDLSALEQSARSASVLLNPHHNSPVPADFFFSTELMELRSGVYNGGFLTVSRCEAARLFIEWFRDRMIRFCFQDLTGLFVDQLWLNHAPNFFANVGTCTHPGANLAHWNLFQRTLSRDHTGAFISDGQPLLFVHFSGWDINDPTGVSKHAPAFKMAKIPQLAYWSLLGLEYKEALLQNRFYESSRMPYAFDKFDNGEPISPNQRRQFYQQVVQQKLALASPLRIK